MLLSIVEIRDVAERTKVFRFSDPDGGPLPRFTAGAHVELTLETPAGRLVRQYSLVSSPDDTSGYEIAVLHTEASRGGSRWLHEEARAGALVEVSAPRGSFRLMERARVSTLIAGGIGITPIVAFARQLRARGSSYRVHYAARTLERMAFAREIAEVHGGALHLDRGEQPTIDLARALAAPADDHHAYVCGPRPMIEAVRRAARELGWRDDHIHIESFGAVARSTEPVTLRLLQSDMTIEVPPGSSLLEAMEQAGAWVSFDCRRGECGKCTISYVEGEVEHLDVCLSEEARRSQLTPCVSRARSTELVVDA